MRGVHGKRRFRSTNSARATLLAGAAGVLATLAAGRAVGQAVTIDFEDLSIAAGEFTFRDPVASRGYHLSAFDGGYENDADGAHRGSLSFFTDSSPIRLTSIDGQPFDLISFAAAEDNEPITRTITVTGELTGGDTVSAEFVIDGILDGPGGEPDFQTFTLPATFVGLKSVTFDDPLADTAIDDIKVSTVPEPAALGACVVLGALLPWRRQPRVRRPI